MPLAAVAGCRWGPAEDDRVVTEQEQDADAALVDAAVIAIDTQLSRLTEVSRAHPGAAAALTGLVAAHQAHLRLLPAVEPGATASPTPGATTPPSAPTSRAALARARAEETALQAQLATLAGSAVSGPLARALASMSASIAQFLASMPALPPEGPA